MAVKENRIRRIKILNRIGLTKAISYFTSPIFSRFIPDTAKNNPILQHADSKVTLVFWLPIPLGLEALPTRGLDPFKSEVDGDNRKISSDY